MRHKKLSLELIEEMLSFWTSARSCWDRADVDPATDSFNQAAFKLYLRTGGASSAATELGKLGYKIDGRKPVSTDVTDTIQKGTIPDTELQNVVKAFQHDNKLLSRRYGG